MGKQKINFCKCFFGIKKVVKNDEKNHNLSGIINNRGVNCGLAKLCVELR